MGRNHFFALFTVISSLVLGTAPVLWGMMIDGFRNVDAHFAGLHLDRYGIYFAAAVVMGLLAVVSIRWVVEPGGIEGVERSPLFGSLQRETRKWRG